LRTKRFLAAACAVALACSVAAAAPTATLEQDRDRDTAAEVAPGQWFDVLVHVDPRGEIIQEEGLKARPAEMAGAEFQEAIFPAPDRSGIYTKPFTVRVPVKLAATSTYELAVTIGGRNTAGAAVSVTATGAITTRDYLKRHVDAKVALKAPAVVGQPNAVVVRATVIQGYHVYGAQFDGGIPLMAMLLPAPGARGALPWAGGGPMSPDGEELEGAFSFEIPFTPARAGPVDLRVLLDWQACTPLACDPNEIAYFPLSFDVEPGDGAAVAVEAPPAEPDKTGLAGKGLLQLVLLSVAAGIFALLMPCTYPLIPITISFFSKQAEQRHGNVVPLALAYGGGIAAIFTLIGLVIGAGFAAADSVANLANVAWLNLLFALLFLIFGLSLLGLFEIRLPSAFDNLAAKASGTGGYLSVFAMGLTLVVTSFTCTAPFVGSLLVFAAKGGQLNAAVICMAVFGLTMAIPFVILSLSPKAFQALPRSGEWMKRLKVTLGIVELGLVLKFLSNVDIARGTFLVDRELFLVLWSMSFFAAAAYLLGILDLFARGVRWTLGPGRALAGLLMLAIGGALVYGSTGPRLGQYVEAFLPSFRREYNQAFLAVTEDYEEGLRIAKERNANVFLHFTGFQ